MHRAESFARLESGKNPRVQASPFGMAEPGVVCSGGVESFATKATSAVPGESQIRLWVGNLSPCHLARHFKEAGHHCSDPFFINQETHMETFKSCLTSFDGMPDRKGKRPNTICGPLHIQCDGGDTKHVRRLVSEVLTWPQVESTPPIVSHPDLISIRLKQPQPANVSLAATGVKEFAKVYLEAPAIYLTLPLVAAHWAILHGWAEPHYLASHGLMPAGTVLLYTPRDESELKVCHFHFSRAYEYAREPVEMKQIGSMV